MVSYGKKRVDIVLQPVSGKALPIYKGEILRIIQVGDGQCVDFNCFNLHDYKEHMSVGHIRRQGFQVKKGNFIWSNPPRFRPMMVLLEIPPTCITDLMGARCNAPVFEVVEGFEIHTNCQDTLAEAIGEYGLPPDDVHDSLNMWMNTGLTMDEESGRKYWDGGWNIGKKGDYVDWMALMDVLAVPVICGSGDVKFTSNFSFKPIQVQVFDKSAETEKLVDGYLREYLSLKNQRSIETFHVKEIKKERELTPIPGYQPRFVNFPIIFTEIEIELTIEDYEQVEKLKNRHFPGTDEEVVRAAVMCWYSKNRRNKSWDVFGVRSRELHELSSSKKGRDA